MGNSPTTPLILYVDDERANRIVFEASLQGEFAVQTVSDAKAALDLLATTEIAVLITDIRMPDMTGDQLLRIVKEKWPGTVRMVITAYSDIEPILAAINEGLVARYVVKPWSRDELVQLLRWALEAWTFGQQSSALQQRLLETERLATLGTIAGSVVHDLNQPLAGLVINAERLVELADAAAPLKALLDGAAPSPSARGALTELAEELTELAGDLRTNALHMRELIAGLGQFLYSRRADSPPPPADPLAIIRSAMAVCHDLAIRARGQIAYEGPSELPRVRMIGTELTQVMINLVANASQALVGRDKPDGRVSVTARTEDQMLVLQVRDNGIGMSPEVLARVGTPFFTTRREGIGLGLAQCQRLIGKSGGSFKIESEVAVGTTITLAIPIV